MRILCKKIKKLNLTVLYLKIDRGSLSDPIGKEGLAHLTEHMFFHSLINGKELSEWLSENSILFEATTDFNDIKFSFIFENKKLSVLLNLFSKLKTPNLNNQLFLREKEIIKEEIMTISGNFESNAINNVFKVLLNKEHIDDIILGSKKSLANIALNDVLNFIKGVNFNYYIFSNLDEQKIRKQFCDMNLVENKLYSSINELVFSERSNNIIKLNLNNKAIAYVLKSIKKDFKEFIKQKILLNYLVNDESLLYKKVRKDGLSYNIWGANFFINNDGFLVIYIETSSPELLKKRVISILNYFKKNKLDKTLFQRAKDKTRVEILSSFDNLSIFDIYVDFGFLSRENVLDTISKTEEFEVQNLYNDNYCFFDIT